jgi:hypothetical protein
MAKIISLDEYRARKDPQAAALGRLDLAVGRLDPLIKGRAGHLSASAEHELAQIARAVSQGLTGQAAERAERLADLLEHPAANA